MPQHLHIQNVDPSLSVHDAAVRFRNEKFLLLLDSAAHIREGDARYTFLTADPIETVRLHRVAHGDDPFRRLREWQTRLDVLEIQEAPPFCGGIAGLMSYELGGAFEIVPSASGDDFDTPALLAGLFDWAVVWDHIESTVQVCVLNIADTRDVSSVPPHLPRLNWILDRLQAAEPDCLPAEAAPLLTVPSGPRCHPLPTVPGVFSAFTPSGYIASVERVIEYIRAGDIFQANLAQQLTSAWPQTAVDLYQQVRQQNPAPFCGLLQADDFAVVSASPERFLKVHAGRYVETRPIKGTRRRHRLPIADLFIGDELFASEKDRAENVMIVDLLRNDLSRVCRPGSVKVTGLCEIEVFETVQHLVSTVIGEMRDGCDVWDLCAATIPGGSITGAPKIRAMEIIAELEPVVRGAYCGNLFYLGPAGDFDSSILIRTFTLKRGLVQFPVGGGIVADSLPEDEYAETLHKAAGMLRSLKAAVGR